jgi:predicted DNA-binding protein (MmcQ/YjbR family)
MTGRSVVAWCRRRPGATEEYPFGPLVRVFKVGGKMFAVGPRETNPNQVTLKADPENAARLRRQYPAVKPGYHANKRHWNTVRLDGSIPSQVVRTMLEESYRLVATSLPAGGSRTSGRRPRRRRRR